MEKFLFSKVEVWVVILLLLIGALAGIGFGAAVLDAERETGRFGAISQTAHTIAEIPDTAKRLLSRDKLLLVYSNEPFEGKADGWNFPSGPLTGLSGYILLSRYDGTEKRHEISLLSLPGMRLEHEWILDVSKLLADVDHVSPFSDSTNWNQSHFREVHPWLMANGDMIVKDHYSPLFRVNPCGDGLWLIDDQVFHHSTEADADGNFWIPSLAERQSLKRSKSSFHEDLITKISPDGKILYSASVARILLRNGYTNWLFANGMYNDDPTHLNDIEPVRVDGPYWRKGDIFLSLRNISTIMQYRPSTGEIIWMKRGPWLSQHDVDILDDHRISIYDNNAQDRGAGVYFDGNSHIMIYDFVTGKVSLAFEDVMKSNNIRTSDAGLFAELPDGSALIEDVTDARLLIARPDGKIAAEYVNRAKDGDVYHLGWSRYIGKQQGDAILNAMKKVKCDA